MTLPCVIDFWQSGVADMPDDLLAEDVVFSSPVADYRGRADASHMLGLISQVVHDVRPGEVARDGGLTISTLTAGVRGGDLEGVPLEGVLLERHDDAGRLVHVTLFLRPYRALTTAIGVMGRRLAASPLPSGRS